MKRVFTAFIAIMLLCASCVQVPAPAPTPDPEPMPTPEPEPEPVKEPEPLPVQGNAVEQQKMGFYFDTVVTMTAWVVDETTLDDALRECAKYENILSKTIEGSDVWRLNHANGEWVDIAPVTELILRKAAEISQKSDGRFDITIAPCVSLWDFTGGTAVLPDADALAAAAKMVDYTRVEVEEGRARLLDGVTIDLGAIAKGCITDRIAEFLISRDVRSGYLNFGGNVLLIGAKKGGANWRIGVQDPASMRGDSLGVVELTDRAVVTSGIYERGFDLDGVRYHHLLDTKTGWPIQNGLAGVTIIAKDAMTADALSTTVFALGLAEGTAFVEALPDVEAVFVTTEGAVTNTSGLDGNFKLLNK